MSCCMVMVRRVRRHRDITPGLGVAPARSWVGRTDRGAGRDPPRRARPRHRGGRGCAPSTRHPASTPPCSWSAGC